NTHVRNERGPVTANDQASNDSLCLDYSPASDTGAPHFPRKEEGCPSIVNLRPSIKSPLTTPTPGMGSEVDPVSWTPEHLCSRSPRWRRRDHLTLLSSVARWSSWCVLAARRRNWQGSSNRPRSRSRTGSVRLSATPAAARAV